MVADLLWSALMSDNWGRWTARPLNDLCDPERGITYGIVKVGEYIAGGIPVIRGGDIRNNRVIFNDEKRVSNQVSNQFRRTVLRGGEIVMNLIAEPGHCAVAPPSMAGFNVSRDVAVVPLVDSVNHSFVNYFLQSQMAIEWLNARLQGSVTQKINLGTLREVPIPLPPRHSQDAIAKVLDALDGKIAVNERIVATADELRALSLRQFATSYPEAVERLSLSSLAKFVNGKAFTKDASGTGRMVVRIAELNSGPGPSTIYSDIEVPPQHLAMAGDVLFAWSGSLRVSRWYRSMAIVNQHIFKVVPRGGIPSWLIFDLLCSELPRFQAIAEGKATTMGHIQRHHLDIAVSVPTSQYLVHLDAALGLLWRRALQAEQETLTLAELRDTLLPRLISGELRIREAEKIVEAV